MSKFGGGVVEPEPPDALYRRSVKPKLLILSTYTAKGPSSRYRVFNYLPYLREGFEVTVLPLFTDRYYQKRFGRYGRRRVLKESLKCYVNRLRDLGRIADYDLVLLEKQMFPFLPASFEKRFWRRARVLVVDFDDAIWHQYDHGSWWVRTLLGRKFDDLLPLADHCTCGSAYLAAHTARFAATAFFPSVIQPKPRPPLLRREDGRFVVGWIGSPSTSIFVLDIVAQLRQASECIPNLLVSLVGFDRGLSPKLAGLPHEIIDWSPDVEDSWLPSIDLGIMPLRDEPFARGKCGLKLVQYMSYGKPWMATALGTNVDLDEARCNYLVHSREEWVGALVQAHASRHDREVCGLRNFEVFERRLSYAVAGPKLREFLQQAAGATMTSS